MDQPLMPDASMLNEQPGDVMPGNSLFAADEPGVIGVGLEGDPGSAPAGSPIREVDEYLLDDVPLFHLPMVGSTILTIAFRVGRADEPVPRGGMTHLAEHLVMTKVSDSLDHSNGGTEPFRVTFTLRGTPAEAWRFLRDVCQAIERPPLSRIHEEANVLRTESAGRSGTGMSLRLAWFRSGFQGVGTVALPEFFLRVLDGDILRTWIADNLTAGNAAIWIAGELPEDLLVALPPGTRRSLPEVRFVPNLETPDDRPGRSARGRGVVVRRAEHGDHDGPPGARPAPPPRAPCRPRPRLRRRQ